MGCDSPSLSLFVRFVSPFIPCLRPSLALSLQKIWQGIETGERLLFSLTHSSFLKSKPTEAKSGYYLSCVSSLSPLAIFFFFFFAQGLWNSTLWKETEDSRSVKTRTGASWTFTGDCCINQEQQKKKMVTVVLECEMDIWQGLWLCVFVHICLLLSPLNYILHTVSSCRVVLAVWPGLLWSDICVVFFFVFFYSLSSEERNKHRPQRLPAVMLERREPYMVCEMKQLFVP